MLPSLPFLLKKHTKQISNIASDRISMFFIDFQDPETYQAVKKQGHRAVLRFEENTRLYRKNLWVHWPKIYPGIPVCRRIKKKRVTRIRREYRNEHQAREFFDESKPVDEAREL
jgi:hypothetical protein